MGKFEQSWLASLSRRLLQWMTWGVAREEGCFRDIISHVIPIEHGDGRPPALYTVDFSFTAHGTFLVSCRELAEVLACTRSEAEGLASAELAIEEALYARRSSPARPG